MEESRNKQIHRLSLEGVTITELAKRFQLSYTRITQIIYKEEWKILNPNSHKMWDSLHKVSLTLTTREIRFLREKGIYQIEQLTTYSVKELLKIKNIGIKSVLDIQNKLQKIGKSLAEE